MEIKSCKITKQFGKEKEKIFILFSVWKMDNEKRKKDNIIQNKSFALINNNSSTLEIIH